MIRQKKILSTTSSTTAPENDLLYYVQYQDKQTWTKLDNKVFRIFFKAFFYMHLVTSIAVCINTVYRTLVLWIKKGKLSL